MLQDTIEFVRLHWGDVLQVWTMIVGIASIIPPLPQGHWALPFVKLLARFVALNTKAPTNNERRLGRWDDSDK